MKKELKKNERSSDRKWGRFVVSNGEAITAQPTIYWMLAPFAIMAFAVTLPVDLLFVFANNQFWLVTSRWLLGEGLLMGALAAVAGIMELVRSHRLRAMRAAWIYAIGNIAVLLLELSNFILRASAKELSFIEVSLSVISVVLLLVTGWVGWKLIGLRRRMS
jgi:uncharacterized membrane protein